MSRPSQAAVPRTATRRPHERLEWIDVAKGLAIMLVVFGHVMFILLLFELPTSDYWRRFLEGTSPMRMPGFFLISGIFVHRLLHRSRDYLIRHRVQNSLYLFLVWLVITIVSDMLLRLVIGERAGTVARSKIVDHFLRLETPLWCLVALAAFHLLWWATRKWPTWLVLLPAAATMAVIELEVELPPVISSTGIVGMLHSAVFFLAGARLSDPIRRGVGRIGPRRATAIIVVWLAIEIIFPHLPFRAFVAVPALFAVAQLISSIRVGRWMAIAGRRTLPLYLMNWLVISWVGGALLWLRFPNNAWTEVLVPLFVLPLVVALITLLWRATRRVAWLYSMPDDDHSADDVDEDWPLSAGQIDPITGRPVPAHVNLVSLHSQTPPAQLPR